MSLLLWLGGGAVIVAILVRRVFPRKKKHIDVGPVSDAWLAEQRARGRESP